mgnify:CR=1 FL=1
MEVALKIAWQWWHNRGMPRPRLIAFDGAYHGDIPWTSPSMNGVTNEDRAHIDHYIFNDVASLDAAVSRARQRGEAIKHEAETQAETLKDQRIDARTGAHDRIEDRLKRVKSGYHARGAKLSQAWTLTKEALAG